MSTPTARLPDPAPSTDVHGARPAVVVAAWVALVVLVVGVMGTVVDAVLEDDAAGNMHALQADAFLHGQLDLRQPVHDVATYQGKVHSPYPPAPAVLLVPLVAVFGLHGPLPTVVALVLAGVSGWLAYRICRRLGVSRRSALVLVAGLLLGTALWSSVLASEGVWFFSHVVALAASLAAFDAALRGRAVATGVFLGVAVLSRQLSICALPLLGSLVADSSPGDARTRRLAGLLLPVLGLGAAYLVFNAARFSGPFDSGLSHIAYTEFLHERVAQHGVVSVRYVPFNFMYLFLQGFRLDFGGSDLLTIPTTADPFGTSLTFASPFLLFALLARPRRNLQVAAWVSVISCVAAELVYHNNGYVQTNAQRFSLDFIPALFVLLIWGVDRASTKLWQGAVAFAVALNFFALVVMPHLGLVDRAAARLS